MNKQRFILRTADIQRNAGEAVDNLEAEPLMEVIIQEYVESKTREQLGYLFAGILPAIRQHIMDTTGETYTVDNIYNYLVDSFAEHSVVTINGKPKVIRVSASKMSVKQMTKFIEEILQYAAEDLSLVIPDPS